MSAQRDDSQRLPRAPRAFHLMGPAADHARGRIRAPLGVRFCDAPSEADAYAIALGPDDIVDVATVARALPHASELPGASLVVVLGIVVERPTLTAALLMRLGRHREIPRALSAGAMLLRGYTELGAAFDPASRVDVTWGYVA